MLTGPEPSRSDGTLTSRASEHGGRPGSKGATEQTREMRRDKGLRSEIRFPAVMETTCVMFPLLPSPSVANHQQILHLRTPSSLPVPSFPFPLLLSHPLHSFHPGFSCFAAQRGAEPRILQASCHVKTLILAKFHTRRMQLWLKEHYEWSLQIRLGYMCRRASEGGADFVDSLDACWCPWTLLWGCLHPCAAGNVRFIKLRPLLT